MSSQADAARRARMSHDARSAAVAELFDALEGLLISYHALPDGERTQRWSGDADRITGEVARHLGVARSRLARVCPQPDAGGPAT
jgi:hypothetical protein